MQDNELRFPFGKNWQDFVDRHLTEERIAEATSSLAKFLGETDLSGRTFLDIGCGSGVFSRAAYELGATAITSFDVDPLSVRCCVELRRQVGDPDHWRVLEGSVLDREFLSGLEEHDIVYSWGVLHHTGDMWTAIRNAADFVAPGGYFFIAIYNKFGHHRGSNLWLRVKRLYNRAPAPGKKLLEYADMTRRILGMMIRLQNPVTVIRSYGSKRGMNWRTDVVDWLGGYPYEFATVEEILRFCNKELGFRLENLSQDHGLGCNEFLFRRQEDAGLAPSQVGTAACATRGGVD